MMRKICLFLLMCAVLWPGMILSQQAPEDKEVIEYLEFRSVDIKDVLRQLAKQYDLNIVFSKSIEGMITVQLHDVTIEEALDSIITINGFVYTKKGGVYKVTTSDEAGQEGKQTRVFRLSNADASGLRESLQKVLSKDGSIEVDTRSNSLIVTDVPRVLNEIEEMLDGLDQGTPQVLIEAKFIETSLGTTEEIGVDWTPTATVSGSKRPATWPFNKWGSDEDYYPEPAYSATLDATTGITTIESEFPFNGSTFGSFPMAEASEFAFGTLDFTSFKAVLDFLQTKTDSKLISSPRIVTMDNVIAEMYVGKARPIPTFEFNEQSNTYQITGFTEKIEGVTLNVTPQVSKTGNQYSIRLKLKPSVTSFYDTVSFANLGFDYPILSERKADTEVMIKDGQTIVIGGLIENKRTEVVHKLPILGDLPIFGALFSHKEINPNSKSELLIFVTATVVKESKDKILAYDSKLITSPERPLKLKLRNIEAK